MRRAARADSNQPDIVRIFRELGATWFSTHRLPGELDGVLGVAGIDQRVEIKDGSLAPSARRLTKAEAETIRDWRGRKPVIVSSEDEAVQLVAYLRWLARRAAWRDDD